MTDDERAIRKVVASWLEASRTGHLARMMSLMSDDAIFMVPGREPFGKEVFEEAAKGQSQFHIEATSDIQEVQVMGDWAYLRNHLTVTMTPRSEGKPTRRSGYTLTILRKQPAGNWLLVRDANLMLPQAD